ncbi:phage tail tube protein [Escherichia coli]|uniref:phage tail tube protein n=1 Tax=Escherichia coli TaxID=562 RepID=UPI003AFB43B3
MATTPFNGANTAQFYVAEVTPGVTPSNPVWSPLRNTGGVPATTRDTLTSNELDGSRETTSIRTGNKQVSGEYAIELSSKSQDDWLAGALGSTWKAGVSLSGLSITVTPAGKTFTRATGSFITDGVEVGDLIAFTNLTGDNAKPFIVTAVTATVVTGAGIRHPLTKETKTSKAKTGDTLETGNACKTFSILTWFKGQCGNPGAYMLTKGVEISGFTVEQAVNAMVTGSFPFIGLSQTILTAPPSGSDFSQVTFGDEPFSSVDVSVFDGSTPLRCDSLTITNDNSASAQFELGNTNVAFVERGRAANTFSISGKLYDMAMIQKFINERRVEINSILAGVNGAMSFSLKRAELTAVTPEIGGPESITQSIEGQATGNQYQSSIVIQRITYA